MERMLSISHGAGRSRGSTGVCRLPPCHADWGVPQILPSNCLEPAVLPSATTRTLLCRIPVRTIFESHPEDGVSAIAISQNAKYLATISAGTVQVKKIFPLL